MSADDTAKEIAKLRKTLVRMQHELDDLIDSIDKYSKMWLAIRELQDLTGHADIVHTLLHRER